MPNQLLQLLPLDDQARLLQDAELIALNQREILIESEELIEQAYFPLTGIVSQLTVLKDGNAVESALIGSDGFVGLSSYLGNEISPMRFIVQVPGEAYRIPVVRLRNWVADIPRLQTLLGRYNDFLLAVASQSAACNRLHSVEQRCVRWLLRIHDRIEGDEMPLTQEFLAQMLGVRRASVSLAAGELQEAGLIRYAYGRVTILNRRGLEAVSCECTEAIERRYEALFASLMG